MIGESNASVANHLKKKIPNQVVRFFDFVESKKTLAIRRRDSAEPAGLARFIASEKFSPDRDAKTLTYRIGRVALVQRGSYQLCFADAGWAKEQQRSLHPSNAFVGRRCGCSQAISKDYSRALSIDETAIAVAPLGTSAIALRVGEHFSAERAVGSADRFSSSQWFNARSFHLLCSRNLIDEQMNR